VHQFDMHKKGNMDSIALLHSIWALRNEHLPITYGQKAVACYCKVAWTPGFYCVATRTPLISPV